MTTDAQYNKVFFYLFYFVIVAVGIGFLAGGIYEAQHASVLYKEGLLAKGRVQKVEDQGNADADWTTYEVAFVATDHKSYTIQNHYSVRDKVKLYKVGQMVPVIYLPSDPQDGRIDNRRERDWVAGGCFLGALFVLLFGAIFYYFFHRPYLISQQAF
ncbi:MAG TPA: DUF3592 domain-containing protein [Hymenobacter sp.]|jgi:hypothetical protein|uniref:DUF3592 domain-containing protein n=1 Tax=Hymenobacter sp. TaxID=1898978 RepID=UPI002EDB8082